MGRRRGTADERVRILEETRVPGAVVPAVVTPEAASATEPSDTRSRSKGRARQRRAAAIEVNVAGVRVTIENGASPATIAAEKVARANTTGRPEEECDRR